MKINNIELNKNNFWTPFLQFFIIWLVVYHLGSSYLSYIFYLLDFDGRFFSTNERPFLSFFTLDFVGLLSLVISALAPVFLIIRRLLSKKPKRVFYFELPIFIIIYYLFLIPGNFLSIKYLINVHERSSWCHYETCGYDIPTLALFSSFFIVIGFFLLTFSLYCYYKERVYKKEIRTEASNSMLN